MDAWNSKKKSKLSLPLSWVSSCVTLMFKKHHWMKVIEACSIRRWRANKKKRKRRNEINVLLRSITAQTVRNENNIFKYWWSIRYAKKHQKKQSQHSNLQWDQPHEINEPHTCFQWCCEEIYLSCLYKSFGKRPNQTNKKAKGMHSTRGYNTTILIWFSKRTRSKHRMRLKRKTTDVSKQSSVNSCINHFSIKSIFHVNNKNVSMRLLK